MNQILKNNGISRREFLKWLGLGATAAFLPKFPDLKTVLSDKLFGRPTRNGIKVFDKPEVNSKLVSQLYLDELQVITEQVSAEDHQGKARTWYKLEKGGFVQDSFIQPVKWHNNVSRSPIPEKGCLGEVTVPFIDAYEKVRGYRRLYRFYYAATFWIQERIFDDWGVPWYRLLDDRYHGSFFIRAYAMRIVNRIELEPIHLEVPPEEKLLHVDLKTQMLTAYEGIKPIRSFMISSGTFNKEGSYYTPRGQYYTSRKRPCRHMASPAGNGFSGFDLPGVPWVSYFTGDGIAFHGAYWHNNFGFPMSHGCVNMTPEDAKWVYLWSLPVVPFESYFFEDHPATKVRVI